MAEKNSAACPGEAGTARRRHVLWIPKERATYSGPLSPERKAECDRELDEMRHQVFEQMDRYIDEYNDRRIDRRIEKRIDECISSVMD